MPDLNLYYNYKYGDTITFNVKKNKDKKKSNKNLRRMKWSKPSNIIYPDFSYKYYMDYDMPHFDFLGDIE